MKNLFAKKTIKILTIAIFSVFVLVFLFSPNPKKTFSAQETAIKSEVHSESTSYLDNEGYEQNITDTTTTYIYPRSGLKAYTTIDRVRTYIDKDGITHTFTNFQDRYGKWWNEKEVIKEVEDDKEKLKDNKLTYTLLQPLPTESGEPLSTNVTLKQYLTWAYKFVLALTGFLAVMMIVIGGVEYIISGANESMRGEAHKRIWGAITGLVLALVAYLVLYTINPSLVNFEDNWFFKPRNEQMQNDKTTQVNSKTTQTNSNINQGVQKINDLKFDEKVMHDSNVSNTGSSNIKDETRIKETGVSNVEIKKTIKPNE